MSTTKLAIGLAGYAAIAIAAYFTLERETLWAVWVLMGGLALKTWVASQQLRAQHAAQAAERRGTDEIDAHEHQD